MIYLDHDQTAIWNAVGVLCACLDVGPNDAHMMIIGSAWQLDVPMVDVAEYVQWRGRIPV